MAFKLLKVGSSGTYVIAWQNFLHGRGFLKSTQIDGKFGPVTEAASKSFQTSVRLIADGLVGKNTIDKAVQYGFVAPAEHSRDVDFIVLHITANGNNLEGQELRDLIERGHIQRGMSEIAYHWLIDKKGNKIQGRDENKIGAGVAGHNTGSIHIAYDDRGSDTHSNDPYGKYMTEPQRKAFESCVRDVMRRWGIKASKVYGHNDFTNEKACPCFRVSKSKELQEAISDLSIDNAPAEASGSAELAKEKRIINNPDFFPGIK